MACRLGEARGEKCVRMLLKSGANPNLPLSDGKYLSLLGALKLAMLTLALQFLLKQHLL